MWASANNIWLQVHAHVVASQVNEHTHEKQEMKQDVSGDDQIGHFLFDIL